MKNIKNLMCLIIVAVVSVVMTLNVSAADKIKIRIVDESTKADFSYQVDPGISLNELKEKGFASKLKSVIDDSGEKYLTFINMATGKSVDLNEKLYSNISIKAIGAKDTIKITIENTGNSFTSVQAGITINQLKEKSYASQVKKLIETDEKSFAKFINVKTGEDIGLNDPLYVDTTIKALYYITVTIDGVDHKVLETTKLEDLYQFAQKKEGYEFTGFVDANGKPATDASVVDKAILKSTYKQIEKAETNPETSDNILRYLGLELLSITTSLYLGVKTFKKIEN